MRLTRSMLGAAAVLLLMGYQKASACSSDPLIGSVCIMATNFCPRGFVEANGQLLPIAQNSALFSLLGTYYGGDGQTTFGVPDLRGRVPVGIGQGPGLGPVNQGQTGGSGTVTLTQDQLPAHVHPAQLHATSANGDVDDPADAVLARLPRSRIYSSGAPNATMSTSAVTVGSSEGGGQPISVRDPYLGLRFCIAILGIYPSRP